MSLQVAGPTSVAMGRSVLGRAPRGGSHADPAFAALMEKFQTDWDRAPTQPERDVDMGGAEPDRDLSVLAFSSCSRLQQHNCSGLAAIHDASATTA